MTIALSRRAFIRPSLSAARRPRHRRRSLRAFAAAAATACGEPWSSETGSGPTRSTPGSSIDPDNTVTLRVAKSEMGQGVLTVAADDRRRGAGMRLAARCGSNTPRPPQPRRQQCLSVDGHRRQPLGPRARASCCSRPAPSRARAADRRGGGALGRRAGRVHRRRRDGAA